MKEIPLSKGLTTIVDDEDYEKIITYKPKWYARSNGGSKVYAATSDPDNWKNKIYLHRWLMNPPEGMEVDHINGDSLDNRRENLRVCTKTENLRNVKGKRKYKGAAYVGKGRNLSKPWSARISYKNKNLYLGYFKTPEEAARAYDKKATELYGEFANLNFKEED